MTRINIGGGAAILGQYANRHGLIAGATGTGKTVTLQTLCEEFSRAGVPVFVADVKGDIAGLAIDGQGTAVNFWDTHGHQGKPFRLTAEALGVDLLARMLEITDAQMGVLEFVFAKYPKMKTLGELLEKMTMASNPIFGQFAGPGGATLAAVNRAVVRFSRQGGGTLIGTPCFDIARLFETRDGNGIINILAADRLINSPVAYSTLMIWLLDELFDRMPEAGDLDRPRLVLFIDEAHLLFQDAPPALLQKIERTVRLIRSKGVGVYFVTQAPDDLPAAVLGQLGNRIQHRLSGATVRDQRMIKAAAETMPINPKINAAEAIAKLATGQALVSTIGHDGAPLPVELIRVNLPGCRLGAVTAEERQAAAPWTLDPPVPGPQISATARAVMAAGATAGVFALFYFQVVAVNLCALSWFDSLFC